MPPVPNGGRLDNDPVPQSPPPPATAGRLDNVNVANSLPALVSPVPFDFANWLERVAVEGPCGADTFTRDGTQAALCGMVLWSQLEALVYGALGYSWIDAPQVAATTLSPGATTYAPIVSAYQLRRVLPANHPRYRGLVCTSVSAQPFRPTATTYAPYRGFPVAPGPAIAEYAYAYVTLTFGQVKYQLYTDELMQIFGKQEYERYTYVEPEPVLEVLGSGADILKFAAGPYSGQEFQGGPAAYLPKQRLRYHWIDVPSAWLFNGEVPVNVKAGYGKVNQTDFLGFPAGTLLLQGATFEKRLLPLIPATATRPFSYDVVFDFLEFDPTRGTTTAPTTTTLPPGTTAAPTTTPAPWSIRGHNLAPGADRYWWPVTDTGSLGGRTLLEPYEFRRLFRHARDYTS